MSALYDEITAELSRQVTLKAAGKFAETAEDMMKRGAYREAFDVLVEEVGEIARAHNDSESALNLRKEWVQVAAVACSALLALDYAMVGKASAI